MNKHQLFGFIQKQKSFLCIGLDPDLNKIPDHLAEKGADGIVAFNRAIIDATKDFCVAYKPNFAFYEALGSAGWKALEQTISHIPKSHLIIADAKRGDIGNTSRLYAKAVFEQLNCDAITVAPYMGKDSVTPFLEFENKWVILLALTSNIGADDFQKPTFEGGKTLFETVISKSQEWATAEQLMYVVGATQTEMLEKIRQLAPDHFLLVPGVGAQGGDLETVAKLGLNAYGGLLVNASRSILYASSGNDFAQAAQKEAQKLQIEMERLLGSYLLG